MMSTKTNNYFCVAAVVLAGCNSGLDTGLEPSKVYDDLTGAEQQQFCEAFDDYAWSHISPPELARYACIVTAIRNAYSAAECKQLADACEANSDSLVTMGVLCDNPLTTEPCSATVGDMEVCLTAMQERYRPWVKQWDCSLLAPPNFETPDECAAIRPACPDVVATEGSTPDGIWESGGYEL